MLTTTEIAGFIGVGLAAAAYVPQVWHLIREHCSDGISRSAFGAWLVASLLVTIRAIAIGAGVFVVLGAIQILATSIVLVCATRYATSSCASHGARDAEGDVATTVSDLGVAPNAAAPIGSSRGRPVLSPTAPMAINDPATKKP